MVLQLLLLIAASVSFAETDPQQVLCRNGKVVRTLSFQVDKNKNECTTVYTKGGVDREIGRGQNSSTCIEVFNQVKGTLEKADWKCKDISALQVFDN